MQARTRNLVYGVLLLMLCGSGSGCAPTYTVISPGATGFVIDRQTRKPIPGVRIAVSRMWEREWPNYGPPTPDEALGALRPPTVFTDALGHFAILPEKKWIAEFPTPEGYGRGTLVVLHPNYKPVAIPLLEDTPADTETILLTPR